MALLEADVALPVVKTFIDTVKQKALGSEVMTSLSPGQVFVSIIHRELVELMGRDKKVLDQGLTFVLDGPDGVEVVTGVDVVAVRAALEAVR